MSNDVTKTDLKRNKSKFINKGYVICCVFIEHTARNYVRFSSHRLIFNP